MTKLLSLALVGVLTAGSLIGCEASAKVDTSGDTDHGTMTKTTVKREAPDSGTTYQKTTETKSTMTN